jgi:hypothetical protein
MRHANNLSNEKVLEFPGPHDGIGSELLHWIRGVVRSGNQLVPALERLRISYKVLRAGKHVTDSEVVLWRVEQGRWQVHEALTDTQGSKHVLASNLFRGRTKHKHLAVRRTPNIAVMAPSIEADSSPLCNVSTIDYSLCRRLGNWILRSQRP